MKLNLIFEIKILFFFIFNSSIGRFKEEQKDEDYMEHLLLLLLFYYAFPWPHVFFILSNFYFFSKF